MKIFTLPNTLILFLAAGTFFTSCKSTGVAPVLAPPTIAPVLKGEAGLQVYTGKGFGINDNNINNGFNTTIPIGATYYNAFSNNGFVRADATVLYARDPRNQGQNYDRHYGDARIAPQLGAYINPVDRLSLTASLGPNIRYTNFWTDPKSARELVLESRNDKVFVDALGVLGITYRLSKPDVNNRTELFVGASALQTISDADISSLYATTSVGVRICGDRVQFQLSLANAIINTNVKNATSTKVNDYGDVISVNTGVSFTLGNIK